VCGFGAGLVAILGSVLSALVAGLAALPYFAFSIYAAS
jgi:hypothetical protein